MNQVLDYQSPVHNRLAKFLYVYSFVVAYCFIPLLIAFMVVQPFSVLGDPPLWLRIYRTIGVIFVALFGASGIVAGLLPILSGRDYRWYAFFGAICCAVELYLSSGLLKWCW